LKPREQRCLRDVFGGVDVAELGQRNRQNAPLVAAAQLAKRFHIAASHAVHELRIGKHALGRSHSQAIELLSYQTDAGRALRHRFREMFLIVSSTTAPDRRAAPRKTSTAAGRGLQAVAALGCCPKNRAREAGPEAPIAERG
jgi:hypothetical protein